MFSRRECIVRLLTLPGLAGLAAHGAAETPPRLPRPRLITGIDRTTCRCVGCASSTSLAAVRPDPA
jgi:hypothetical protein